jgi:hypothetical protein
MWYSYALDTETVLTYRLKKYMIINMGAKDIKI